MIEFLAYVEEREAHNYPHKYEIWDRDKTCVMLGTDAFLGEFVDYRDGHLHPLKLCIGEAQAAHSLGVQIFELSVTAPQDSWIGAHIKPDTFRKREKLNRTHPRC